ENAGRTDAPAGLDGVLALKAASRGATAVPPPDDVGASEAHRFVAAALVACLALLAATLALNVVVDPFALAHTNVVPGAVENDRAIKLDLIERLRSAPGTLILGSSRARQAEPAYLRRLTGRSGFNAAVTGGTAADAWVMTRYLADRKPLRGRAYLWFVD